MSFDGWVLRAEIGELARDGRKVRLQDQPLQILEALLSRPGELVTREELIARLWPKGVVDYDTGLNSAVRKLRVALQDDADAPRYIETVPRKGYRFIGVLDPPAANLDHPGLEPSISSVGAVLVSSAASGATSQAIRTPRLHTFIAACAVLLIAAGSLLILRRETLSIVTPAPQYASTQLEDRTLAVLPLRTAAADEAGSLLAQSLTDLIRNRLATLEDLVVIASSSTAGLTSSRASLRAAGERLHARFLVTGGVERVGEQLQLDIALIDARSGKQVWARVFDRPLADTALIREEIFQHVASALKAKVVEDGNNPSAQAGISLDAYQLYMRGQHLMANETVADMDAAIELFRRATVLDPGFARAYVSLAQAQRLASHLKNPADPTLQLAAQKAIDRALELNPALGEAWIERARWNRDPAEAEALYRKGIEHAPNYGSGYSRFAEFLFVHNRVGEAIAMVDHARTIDPLATDLYLNQAFLEIVARSDVAAHDRLVRQALDINPNLQRALQQLAESRWEYSGEFADAARIVERAIALDPQSEDNRILATHIYLDLGEVQSAMAVRSDPQRLGPAVEILQYQRDQREAAELTRTMPTSTFWYGGAFAIEAEAVRDGAILTGDYASALARLESAYATRPSTRPPMWSRYQAMVYAHTLVLAGQAERGRKLAAATLVLLDSHSIGRKKGWLARERAAGYMVLGERERALAELTTAVRTNRLYRWWYTFELDPLFEPLRRDPRFAALKEQAKKHCDRQRALLEQMRRKGEVPRRHS
jgi:TolB-like protein/Tfp pilus assembly protein PilF